MKNCDINVDLINHNYDLVIIEHKDYNIAEFKRNV